MDRDQVLLDSIRKFNPKLEVGPSKSIIINNYI